MNGAGVVVVGVAMLIFAAAAIAAGGWSRPQRLSGNHENATGSVVAANARGFTVAAWYRLGSGNTLSLRGSTRRSGRRFSAPVTLGPAELTIGGNAPSFPSVAVDRRGDAAVAWLKKDSAGNLRVVVAYRPAKGHFHAARDVSASGFNSFQPQIAANGRGDFTVVWQQFENGSFQIEAATRRHGQQRFGAARRLSGPGLDAQFPHVGVAADGRIAVVWRATRPPQTTSFIQAVTRSAAGKYGQPQVLSNRTLSADNPKLATAPDGKTMAVWQETNGSTVGHVAAAFSASGRKFGREQVLPPRPDHAGINPRVAIDSRGRAVIVWLENSVPGKTGPNLGRWAAAGARGNLSAPHTLFRAGFIVSPWVADSPQGTSVAVWIRAASPSAPSRTLLAAIRPAGAKTFRLAGRLASAGTSPGLSQVAASSARAIAVWVQQGQGNQSSVYASHRRIK